MEQAFVTLRRHARSHNLRLVDLANDVISGAFSAPRSSDGTAAPNRRRGQPRVRRAFARELPDFSATATRRCALGVG